MVQYFKGDAVERKIYEAGLEPFQQTDTALDQFFNEGDSSDAFVLTLYDAGRIPFSQRIPRDVFPQFFRRAVENFPFIGNFESYLFILREIFGDDTEILFDVPSPGILEISVNAAADVLFDFIVTEFQGGFDYDVFSLTTHDGDELVFAGISGIDTEAELNLLFAEMMPAGIIPHLSLEFFTKSFFIGEDDDGEFNIGDSFGNDLIFVEIGG